MRFIRKYFEKEFLVNKHPSFHFINTIGWSILIAVDCIIVSPQQNATSITFFISNTIAWSTGYLITIYLRRLYKDFPYRSKSIITIGGFIFTISFFASCLFYLTVNFARWVYSPPFQKESLQTIFSFQHIILFLIYIVPLFTTWSLLYFGIKFWIDLLEEREKAQKASLLAQSAQLQMLRYQINPHFLFNSFSSLRALIRIDQIKAENMLSKLSEFYRYTLVTKSHTEIPLIEEVEAITNYAEIEKIRFEDKIEFEFKIDTLAEEYPIPSFLIHPLVENAIKYGMKTSEMPLKIWIIAEVENNWLIIRIINTGKYIKQGSDNNHVGTGNGLLNIKNRLEYSYPYKNKFEINEQDGKVCATVKIFKELK
ncbi:MAG: histidine kinase [Ignavibacteriales bacterium]|nr:histidine kinase [Ignavibacteriales bacterium]